MKSSKIDLIDSTDKIPTGLREFIKSSYLTDFMDNVPDTSDTDEIDEIIEKIDSVDTMNELLSLFDSWYSDCGGRVFLQGQIRDWETYMESNNQTPIEE